MVQLSLLSVATLLIALALFVRRAKPRAPAHRWFAIFALAVANWTVGIAGLQTGNYLNIWGRYTFASASLIPAASLAFIYFYPTDRLIRPSLLVKIILVAAAFIA